jgi:cysteinyl-tRNA synthetase
VLLLTLDPTANAVVSAKTAYRRFYGFKEEPSFLEDWTKYGLRFISSAAMKMIKDGIGIRKLNRMIEQRSRARARGKKAWAESDRIRDELAAMGIVLKDTKEHATWEVVR